MKDGSHPHRPCQPLSRARNFGRCEIPRTGHSVSCSRRSRAERKVAGRGRGRRRGRRIVPPGFGHVHSKLASGKSPGAWDRPGLGACASSHERGASSLGFVEVEASVVACDEPVSLAASPQWRQLSCPRIAKP